MRTRPLQTHSLFVGPRDPPFLSCARRTAGWRRRSGRGCAPGRSQISVRMCRGGIYNSATQAVLGMPFLGGSLLHPRSLQFPAALPAGRVAGFGSGGTRVRDPCSQCVGVLHNLAPCRHLGLRKGLCYQPSLARPLDPFLRPGRSREA